MVTQKLISLKLDFSLLDSLSNESLVSARKRNRIINDAIEFYLKVNDMYRLYKSVHSDKFIAYCSDFGNNVIHLLDPQTK